MIGERVSHYAIESALGSGGMGVVYRARDTRLERGVALKFLPPALGRDPRALERFQREARAASALNHPGICAIYDIGETEGRPFIVMELLEGETVQQRLVRGPLPLEEVVECGAQIADALDAAHARGIIHRDLKPANLFITTRGHVKILDFGLAKMTVDNAAEQPTAADAALDLTSPGVAVGTIAYMSPEQALAREVDARTDIFSLGVVLYEMATGQPAFAGSTSAAIFDGILNRTPPAHPRCPPALMEVIARATAKDPNLRFPTALDLRRALRPGLTSSAAAASPSPLAGRRRRRLTMAAAAALAALAIGGYWLVHRRAPPMSAKDTVVLADFTNSTGDAMFDGSLRQALAVDLEQSPFLTLVSDQRMAQTAQLMGLAPGTAIRGATALQLCLRTASAAALQGSIAQIGDQYNLILNAVNCASGDTLASTSRVAAGKDQVLSALGALAASLRAKLGESLASMHEYDVPIEQVTTPSLEALKIYSLGRKALEQGAYQQAIGLFQQALTLDQKFAMAYASLATAETDATPALTPAAAAVANMTRAYELRDRVSAHERLYISAHFDQIVKDDWSAARRDYELWEQTYPNDSIPYGNLCNAEMRQGPIAAAVPNCQAAFDKDPTSMGNQINLIGADLDTHQFAAAERLIAADLAAHPNSNPYHQAAYALAAQQGNATALATETAWLHAHGADSLLHQLELQQAFASGTIKRMRQLANATPVDPGDVALLAAAEGMFGDRQAAADHIAAARRQSNDLDVVDDACQVYAEIDDLAKAASCNAELDRRFGQLSKIRNIDLPINRAWAALAAGEPGPAMTLLATVQPYETGEWAGGQVNYLRGLALLRQGQAAAAVGELETAAQSDLHFSINAVAWLGLARARHQAGDNAGAHAAYEHLFGLWKNADPDLPLLLAARTEYAALPR
ncbi:MAG TPA: protein kinase [Terriglobales bacterium]